MVQLRPATSSDLVPIHAIYEYYVPRSTCTFQLEPGTMEERRAWFEEHGARHPIVVAEEHRDGAPAIVTGWASLGPFRSRAAYGRTVELSVYVRHDRHGRGLGRTLVEEVIRRARELGYHVLVAGVSGDQGPSLAMHRALGFREVGHFHEVGFKFGRFIDVIFFELNLGNDASVRLRRSEALHSNVASQA